MTKILLLFLFTSSLVVSFDTSSADVHGPRGVPSSGAPCIKSITFVGSQVHGGRRAPPRVLATWPESLRGTAVAPLMFDAVCTVEAPDGPATDYIALTTIEFVVAPASGHRAEDWARLIHDVSWGQITEMDDLRTAHIRSLRSGETRELRFSNYDLRPVLEAFSERRNDLWPWVLRLRVVILDHTLTRVAVGEATLPLVPSEKRL